MKADKIKLAYSTNKIIVSTSKSRHAKRAAEHFYMNTSIETMAKLDRCGVKAVGVGYVS